MHQFRDEVARGFQGIHERLASIEAAAAARGIERARSAAKGGDFEDILAAHLADIARGSGDLVDRTADEIGDVLRSKKGDFVVTVDPARTGGSELRIVVEAKDRGMSLRSIRDELRDAKENRSAAVALVVFSEDHAPAGVAPFDVRAGDVYCAVDPTSPDPAVLQGALGLARLLAIASLRDERIEIDAEAVRTAIAAIRGELEALKGIKATLTSIANSATGVQGALDRLRDQIVARVCEAEAEIRAASTGPG
jgi:hypothetical protein